MEMNVLEFGSPRVMVFPFNGYVPREERDIVDMA